MKTRPQTPYSANNGWVFSGVMICDVNAMTARSSTSWAGPISLSLNGRVEKVQLYNPNSKTALCKAQKTVFACKTIKFPPPNAALWGICAHLTQGLPTQAPAAIDFITDVYGDVSAFIEAKIEELVHLQKAATPVMLGAIAETTDTDAIVAAVLEKLTAQTN